MVAAKWNWDLAFMMSHFGWKAILSVLVSTSLAIFVLSKELKKLKWAKNAESHYRVPLWLVAIHSIFLLLIVMYAHHSVLFFGVFLFFVGIFTVTKKYQSPLNIRQALLVSFFLGGLVVLGGMQSWWLEPILRQLSDFQLLVGATLLTAVTDNAALTYLGSQVEGLSDLAKIALVEGAVIGGGLTVIANAPNPVGYGLLQSSFGKSGIHPIKLLAAALPFTLIAFFVFWLL
jgi:hypothetical protein